MPLIVACALFMENLDSTVVTTALPAMARSLHEPALRLSLTITSYLLALAVFIPVSGWAADRFGARRVFCGAIITFTMGSILCGISLNLWQLVLARVFQGIGGAMMVPVGRLMILRMVPKADLVSAMSFLALPALLGPVLGPPVGGFIVTYTTWRWIFLINVPIGLLGFFLVTRFIEPIDEDRTHSLDLWGWLLLASGLVSLVFALESAVHGVISTPVDLSLFALGAALLAMYVRRARRVEQPVLDLSLLRIPTFGVAIAGGTIFRVAIAAIPFLLPLLLQLGFGLSPFVSGLITLTSALGAMAMKVAAPPILRRFRFRTVLIFNSIISSVFLLAYAAFRPTTPYVVILLLLLLGGFFRSLQFTSVNTLSFADIPVGRMSQASSFSSTAQQVSRSVGVSAGALLLHFTMAWQGHTVLDFTDFIPAFIAIAVLAAASCLFFIKLPVDAGHELQGTIKRVEVPVAPRRRNRFRRGKR